MASSSRTISQTVWEAQKETILHLRFTEGLPLSNKSNKNGGRTVMQVMRDDHRFEATQSQYEQQLKRWGAAKHMKQSDWESILPIYNRVKQQGLIPRIRLGKTVLDERRVMKAQRRYFPQLEQVAIAAITPRMSFAQNNLLKLDVRQHSGEYVEYAEFDATFNAEEIPTLTAPVQPTTACPSRQDQAIQDGHMLATGSRFNLATLVPESDIQNNALPLEGHQLSGEHLEYPEFDEVFDAEATLSLVGPVQPTSISRNAQCQALQDNATLALSSPLWLFPRSPAFDVSRPNRSPLEIERGDEGISSSSAIQQHWSADDPGNLLETFVLTSPTRSVTHVNERTRSPDLAAPRRLLFKPYIDSIIDRIISDFGQTENEFGNISAQMLAIRLEHLLVEDSSHASGCTSDLMSPSSDAVSQLPRIITFCFVNNLAGLDEFPLCLLFGLIKADANVRKSLLDGLRSNNASFATALADCALRSAIRAGDEDIVAIILETTKGNINKIDLNSTVYHFDGKQYSPLGIAAEMCHLGVVRKLLNFGANLDVGALDAVVWSWHYSFDVERNEKKNAKQEIIGIFLANGASANCTTLELVLQYCIATSSTLESLFCAVFRDSHWQLLGMGNLAGYYLVSMMKNNSRNETLFFDLLETCKSMGCLDSCTNTHSHTFDRILISVIEDGNFEAASYLLDYIQLTTGSLTAAIRTRNCGIIQALLNRKFDMNESARCFGKLNVNCHDVDYYDECNCVSVMDGTERWCRPATPLAEAILWGNQDLISTLEECGALGEVRDGTPGHLTAALVAAVIVGDVQRLKRLLRLGGTCKSQNDFEAAIAEAICAGQVEMTKILFMSRINDFEGKRPSKINYLLLALKRRAYEIIFFLLEYGENFGSREHAVLEAVRWGDEAVIECMYDWEFFGPDTLRRFPDPHREEIPSTLGEAMVARNFELVNRLLDWGADPSEHIPFAVSIGDENMVRFLLDQGGKPSGVEQAISDGKYGILELLLGRGAAPVGLEQTIKSGEHDMMRLLLRYGADPADDNAFSAALLCDDGSFLSTLSDAFLSRYPSGKRRFGFRALKIAVLYCDTPIFKHLLMLNLDVNSYEHVVPYDLSSSILQIAIAQRTEWHGFHNWKGWNRDRHKCSLARRTDSEWEEIITLLLEAGADPEIVSEGSTALLRAIEMGRIQTVKLLLDRAINVNRPAGRGLRRTPLQQACEKGDLEIIELLLGKGADVNAPPAINGGATALQLAVIKGSPRVVRLLLDKGANIHGPKAVYNGRTALEGAAEHGRLDILKTLITEGASCFGADEIKRAKALAVGQGHRGCAERLKLALDRLPNRNL